MSPPPKDIHDSMSRLDQAWSSDGEESLQELSDFAGESEASNASMPFLVESSEGEGVELQPPPGQGKGQGKGHGDGKGGSPIANGHSAGKGKGKARDEADVLVQAFIAALVWAGGYIDDVKGKGKGKARGKGKSQGRGDGKGN